MYLFYPGMFCRFSLFKKKEREKKTREEKKTIFCPDVIEGVLLVISSFILKYCNLSCQA